MRVQLFGTYHLSLSRMKIPALDLLAGARQTRACLGGDHKNRRRISFGNFGRKPHDQPVLWIHPDLKTRVYAGFFERFSEGVESEGLECG